MINKLRNQYLLIAIVFSVITSFALVSCGDDDDSPKGGNLEKVMIGTWAQDGDNDILVINSDGTAISFDSSEDYQNNQVAQTFKWKYNDGWVMMVSDDGDQIEKMRVKTVSDNKIVWKRYAIESDDYDPSEDEWDGHDSFGYYDLWTWERYK